MSGAIKVGITSWTEPTLISSGFYPKGATTAESRLRYYTTQFPIVENDSSHYALPSAEQATLWVDRTPAGFTMNVKAFATLTEHYTDPRRLPKDLREALSEAQLAKPHLYPRDLGDEMLREIARRFQAGIAPLIASKRLGVVLFQFPVWFANTLQNRQKLGQLCDLLPDARIAVEFRNATWMKPGVRPRTLRLLRDLNLAYTCVDEPQGFTSSIPRVAEATSDIAVVRFHGRKRATWSQGAQSARERFRYRYPPRELREWVPKIEHLASKAEVHVLMNNCYADYPVRNARQLVDLLEEAELAPKLAISA